ncbi:MAG: hypothetical protein ACRD2I_26890, partial [Vicinamibacterales bacterium]
PFNGASAREIGVEIDLAKNDEGAVDGRFSQPAQNVKGLPLSNVTVDGRSISLELKATNGGGLFRGTLADAGTISGEFVTTEGGYNIPFDLKRTGDAQIAPPPRSAPIDKELEGRWRGAVDVGGKSERLVLTMRNNADGTASGTILDLDGSNVEIPVAMTQRASSLIVEVAVVNAMFTATLNPGNELVGTWSQGAINLPLTLTRMSR